MTKFISGPPTQPGYYWTRFPNAPEDPPEPLEWRKFAWVAVWEFRLGGSWKEATPGVQEIWPVAVLPQHSEQTQGRTAAETLQALAKRPVEVGALGTGRPLPEQLACVDLGPLPGEDRTTLAEVVKRLEVASSSGMQRGALRSLCGDLAALLKKTFGSVGGPVTASDEVTLPYALVPDWFRTPERFRTPEHLRSQVEVASYCDRIREAIDAGKAIDIMVDGQRLGTWHPDPDAAGGARFDEVPRGRLG